MLFQGRCILYLMQPTACVQEVADRDYRRAMRKGHDDIEQSMNRTLATLIPDPLEFMEEIHGSHVSPALFRIEQLGRYMDAR
ncbi:MAG: hypothetical protein CMM86_17575 [Rhodovulum sp.]|nr:hypothetical protein [Rhodovulum sp.]